MNGARPAPPLCSPWSAESLPQVMEPGGPARRPDGIRRQGGQMLTEASRTPALRTPNTAGSKAGNFFSSPSYLLIRVPITTGAGAPRFLISYPHPNSHMHTGPRELLQSYLPYQRRLSVGSHLGLDRGDLLRHFSAGDRGCLIRSRSRGASIAAAGDPHVHITSSYLHSDSMIA